MTIFYKKVLIKWVTKVMNNKSLVIKLRASLNKILLIKKCVYLGEKYNNGGLV